MEVEYQLTAKVDGVEVYKQTAESLSVLEESLYHANQAVQRELAEQDFLLHELYHG